MEDNKERKTSYDPRLYTEAAKKDRFHRVGEKRIRRTLNEFRLIGNMGNRSLYSYTDAEVEKMFKVIESRLSEIKGRFRTKSRDDGFRF